MSGVVNRFRKFQEAAPAYVLIVLLQYILVSGLDDALFYLFRSVIEPEKLKTGQIVFLMLWLVNALAIAAVFGWRTPVSDWMTKRRLWLLPLLVLAIIFFTPGLFVLPPAAEPYLLTLLHRVRYALAVLFPLYFILHRRFCIRGIIYPELERSWWCWPAFSLSGVLAGIFFSKEIFRRLSTDVPYQGTVGYELWTQIPQKNEDLAYLAFLLVAVLLPFFIWVGLWLFRGRLSIQAETADTPATENHAAGSANFQTIGRLSFIFVTVLGLIVLWPETGFHFRPGLDLFHLGEAFVPAMQWEAGQRPYLDFWPIHGLLVDTLHIDVARILDLPAFSGGLFIHAILGLFTWLILLNLLLRLSTPGIAAFTALIVLLSGETRFLRILPILLVFSLVKTDERGKKGLLAFFVAGLLAAFSMPYSQDTGYSALAAVFAFALFSILFSKDRRQKALHETGALVSGLLLGYATFAAWLYSFGGMEAIHKLIETQSWVLRAKAHHDSIPFPEFSGISEMLRWLRQPILIAMLGLAWMTMLQKKQERKRECIDRRLWFVLLVVATIWYKKVLDRSDIGHLLFASSFIPLLFAAFANWFSRNGRAFRSLVLFSFLTFISFSGFDHFAERLEAVFVAPFSKAEPLPPEERLCPDLPWPDKIDVPLAEDWLSGHEELIDILRKGLSAEETFYDFSNSGLIYYIADKRPPCRFNQNFHIMNEAMQEEVLSDLRKAPLRTVVWRIGNGYFNAIDGISNELRLSLLSAWILATMRPEISENDFLLLGPDDPMCGPARDLNIYDPSLDLKHLPRKWGIDPPDWLRRRGLLDRTTVISDGGGEITLDHHRDLAAVSIRIESERDGIAAIRWRLGTRIVSLQWNVVSGARNYFIPVGSIAGWVWAESPLLVEFPPDAASASGLLLPDDFAAR